MNLEIPDGLRRSMQRVPGETGLRCHLAHSPLSRHSFRQLDKGFRVPVRQGRFHLRFQPASDSHVIMRSFMVLMLRSRGRCLMPHASAQARCPAYVETDVRAAAAGTRCRGLFPRQARQTLICAFVSSMTLPACRIDSVSVAARALDTT